MQKGVKFYHNLDEVPLEIRSNTPKGTEDKYVWFKGTIASPVSGTDEFSVALVIEDNSAYIAFCNGRGQAFFNPEPTTTEVIWTVFKTSQEMVFECNGEFCLKYTYSDSVEGDERCETFNQPSIQMFFVDHTGQVAEEYRASGTVLLSVNNSYSGHVGSRGSTVNELNLCKINYYVHLVFYY